MDNFFSRDSGELGVSGKFSDRITWLDTYAVTSRQVREAMKKFQGDRKAPGPDGVLGGIISSSGGQLSDCWATCFTQCLREGLFS